MWHNYIFILFFFIKRDIDILLAKFPNLEKKIIMCQYPSKFIRYKQERTDIAKRFYNAILKIKIEPEKMTQEQVFKIYQNYFNNKENLNAIFDDAIIVNTETDTCRQIYSMRILQKGTSKQYSLRLFKTKDNHYNWSMSYYSRYKECGSFTSFYNVILHIDNKGSIIKFLINPPICFF